MTELNQSMLLKTIDNKKIKITLYVLLFIITIFIVPYGTSITKNWRNNRVKLLNIPIIHKINENIYINPNSIYFNNTGIEYPDSSINPIPSGILTSSYSGTHSDYFETIKYYTDYRYDSYFIGYVWNDYYQRYVPNYKKYKQPYTAEKTIYHDYTWDYNIFIFKSSEKYGLLDTEMYKANKYLDKFKQKIANYEYWEFEPKFYWQYPNKSHSAISYIVKDEKTKVETVRTIIYANGNVIMIEVSSPHGAIQHVNNIINDFTIYNPQLYKNKIIRKIYTPYFVLALSILLFAFIVNYIPKNKVNNKIALRLLRTFTALMLCCTILIFIQWNTLLTGYYDLDKTWENATFNLGCGLIFGFPILLYIKHKCKHNYSFDYIIPSVFLSYLNKRDATEAEKKSVVIFICYPFLAFSLFGIYAILYSFIICAVLILIFEIKTLYLWINKNNKDNNKPQTFKDYYLILNIPFNASHEEIDIAYYKAISNSFSKQNKLNIQEAYRILSSETILRPLYDKEYSLYYQSQNFQNYKIQNKKLEADITFIKDELKFQKRRTTIHWNFNKVGISFIISIIILYLLI